MEIAIIIVAFVLAAALIALFITVQVFWHRAYQKTLPDGTPCPKQSFKEWCKNHTPSKRRLIQIYAALLYNANVKGFISGDILKSRTTKYMCVPGFNCYSCPGAIGACPLGALQNALAESNKSFPFYVLGILSVFGLIFARTICGFLCPVGLGQDLLYKIRTPKLKKSRATRVLSYLKYVFLAVLVIAIPLIYAFQDLQLPGFCKYVCPAGTLGGAIMLLLNPANAGMYENLGPLFTWKFCVMIAIITASVFIYRFFCRFICPLGAIYGFFNRFSLLGIKVESESCTDCGLCVSHCKMDVKRVGDHECINCGECISVCPTKAIRWKGAKLFVHANTVDVPAAETERPLGNLVTQAPVAEAAFEVAPLTAEAEAEQMALVTSEATANKPKPKKSKRFWLELSAWIAALVVLVSAIVYFNAIDVDRTKKPLLPTDTGYEVGDFAPDFTLEMYGSDGEFNLYEHRGKITIVNFWATWCGGCKTELPYFNEVAKTHTEWNVVAIHGESIKGYPSPEEYIATNCSDWVLPFAQDKIEDDICVTFAAFGGRQMWPLTVIVDEEGYVIYNSTYEFKSYAELETAVLTAKAESAKEG